MIFRYPGGKTKLIPITELYLSQLGFKDGDAFHDVFVGGGAIATHVAKTHRYSHIYLNDLDPWISAFWSVIIGDWQAFAELKGHIENKPTIELFKELRETEPIDIVEEAYRAVFFNRTTFSGILTSGPIGGYNQKSKWTIDCRYNITRLQNEMEKLRKLLLNRTTVTKLDAIEYIKRNDSGFLYLDPPYFKEGAGLYRFTIDHKGLARELLTRKRWLLFYDDNIKIRKLYDTYTSEIPTRYSIAGHKYHWKGKKELIITPQAVNYMLDEKEAR